MVPIRLTYWLIGVTKLLERSCQAYPANCILKVFSEKFSLLVLFCPNCEPCFTGYLAVLWKQLHSVARDLTQSLWWVLHFIASNRRAALLKGQRGGGIKIGGETCFRIVFSYFLYKLNVTFDLILRCLGSFLEKTLGTPQVYLGPIKITWKKFGSPEINFSWWDLKLKKWPKMTFPGPIWVPKYFPVLAILGALWVPESKF